MLNASYNLPSEDCNTEKQMVFHSNKLLCVYSLQSWLSDTFTFGSELPCHWQPVRGSWGETQRLWEGASCSGGDAARPPRVPAVVQNQITGKCCAPDSAGTCRSGRALGASCLWKRLIQGHGGGSEAAPAALLSVTARDHAHCRPHSPSRAGREMQRRQVVCALQERD